MDAQNAAEATASTKPAASSISASVSSRQGPDAERSKVPQSVTKSPSLSRLPLPATTKDASSTKPSKPSSRPSASALPDKELSSSKAAASGSSTGALSKDAKLPTGSSSRESKQEPKQDAKQEAKSDAKQDDDGGTDGNSEAETIVLSKDGSPSKPRNKKVIKHEDRRNGDSAASSSNHTDSAPSNPKHVFDKKDHHSTKSEKSSLSASAEAGVGKLSKGSAAADAVSHAKRKRLQQYSSSHARSNDASSSLSSAPGSPSRSRQHSTNPPSGSDSERGRVVRSPNATSSSKDRLRPPEKLIPHKRKASKAGSEDEAEIRKARRQRLASASAGDALSHSTPRTASKEHPRHERSTTKSSVSRHVDSSHNRSQSPPLRAHRRSLSTQALSSQSNGLGLKKKRVPAPLHPTDYHSDDSSAGGSPRMRSSKLRSLATPATADSSISPAKIGPHKKHLDAHGQTFLARACARGEYDLAKQRLVERPEDLNVADFAGNTPLQIASINGYGNIVKLLIDAGCNLDCVNYDKDTPLLDAVDNGHLEVVRLLLDAGVNPRKANVNGEEPLDRVEDEVDNASEIRAALVSARKKVGDRRLTSEEHRHEHDDGRFSHGPESPRRSPAPSSSHATASGRRPGTVRATKTSNHLLYMPMDDKTLRLAAGRGDEETVTRILQVRDVFDDPESMVAAARGGHEIVMQLLLALGRANPDPQPVSSMPPEHATPMLAAIGQENLNVVSLLLDQNSFNPTQKFRGETYYEIARQRAGPNWKEEEDILKTAYDNYKKSHTGKESRKTGRTESRDDSSSRAHKRKLSSPSQERVKRPGATKATTSTTSPREEKLLQKRISDHSASQGDGQSSPKRGSSSLVSAKHKRDDRSSVTSAADRDTPPPSKQVAKSKKADSDAVTVSSEGETAKPRRKLISGRELKGERERERQRRASLVSVSNTTPLKESSSPHESRHDESIPDKARVEKHRERDRDRARLLKKEESKEPASGDGTSKRHRSSETPPHQGSSDKDVSEAPPKRRRLETEVSKDKKSSKVRASPDELPSKSSSSTARDTQASSKTTQKRRDDDDRKTASSLLKSKRREASSDRSRKESSKPLVVTTEKSIHVKSEDVDVDMVDIDADARHSSSGVNASTSASSESLAARDKDEEKKKAEAEAHAAEAKKKEEEHRRRQEEAAKETKRKREEEKRQKEEEKRKREEEDAKRKGEEEEKKRKQLELEDKKKKEEEERQKERKRVEEEERKRKEEERKRKEEEEKKQREVEERKRKEEEERKKREDEERLRQEQIQKEAAEEARRKREEEVRKERERKEQERIRAEKEAEEQRRRQWEEEERVRIAKLPALLRWLSVCANAKSARVAQKFSLMQGVRYDCINPTANNSADGREQWLLNTQVALILGEKDLDLSQYSSWKRIPASMIAKRIVWRLESDRYSLTSHDLYEIGAQLPGYYGTDDPQTMSYRVPERLRGEAWEKFSSTDMFFVKASDVMAILPSIPHLRDVRLTMAYRELPEDESSLTKWATTQKWKNDPGSERFYGFAPGNKYYVNGKMVKEERPGLSEVSRTPFPVAFVPRHNLRALSVEDPEYKRQVAESGTDASPSLGVSQRTPKLPNGTEHSPKPSSRKVNGRTPLSHHPVVNGDSGVGAGRAISLPNGQPTRPLVNGVNGTRSG